MSAVLLLLVLLDSEATPALAQSLNSYLDVKTLSELPLDKLLQVQNSFKIGDVHAGNANLHVPNATISDRIDKFSDAPLALGLQLQRKKEALNRGHYDEHEEHGEKNKISSIFQLSVTSLAFLSFGGYLLCLIVQAIRMGQTAQNNATAAQQQVLAAILNNQANANRRPLRVRNRRPNNRRPNKLRRKPSGSKKNRRPSRHKRESSSSSQTDWPQVASSDNMYYALVTLSEAYTNYHTTDYQHFNETITRNGI